jgi:hypothetical protein
MFFKLCKRVMSDGGYGACHFSLRDNAKVCKSFLQFHLRAYLNDSSIVIGSSEYEFDRVCEIVESHFTILHKCHIQNLPFLDDDEISFDWMVKSVPIAHYFKAKNDLGQFIEYFRAKWKEIPVQLVASQCELIFKK